MTKKRIPNIEAGNAETAEEYWQYVEGIVSPQADITSEHGNCMKRFWTYIKHRRADNNTILPLKSDVGAVD